MGTERRKRKKILMLFFVCLILSLGAGSVTSIAASNTTIKVNTKTQFKKSKTKLKKASKKTKTGKSTSTKTSKKTKKYSNRTEYITTKVTTTTWKYYKRKSKVVNIKKRIVTKTTTKTVRKSVAVNNNSSNDGLVPIGSMLSGVSSKVGRLWNVSGMKLKYDGDAKFAGKTDIADLSVTLRRNGDKDTFLHELGHVVWYFSTVPNKTNLLNTAYKKDKSKYNYPNKVYVTSSPTEFFAECYKLYEESPGTLKKKCPNMYSLVVKAIKNIASDSKIKWITSVIRSIG